jgi:hypothetical protein
MFSKDAACLAISRGLATAMIVATACDHADTASLDSPQHDDANPATVSAQAGSVSLLPRASGLWLNSTEIAALPDSGGAWDNVKRRADSDCGTPDLSDQDSEANVCIMAKALVFVRTGEAQYRDAVLDALRKIVSAGTYDGRSLALGRELAAYVIAADLIDLKAYDPSLDGRFRSELRTLLTTRAEGGGARNLIECHERRPNNWGTHCGASRVAVAAYLGDRRELDRAAGVFRGYLGDRSSYAEFRYGDASWQCDPRRPVGINAKGCMKNRRSVDGVLPDDQRRGGRFGWPPPKENYVWEALQGAVATAMILHRQGYDAFEWGDKALLRAVQWLHEQARYPAEGDDTWIPHMINHFYKSTFPAPIPSSPGKNVGWSDWTHR